MGVFKQTKSVGTKYSTDMKKGQYGNVAANTAKDYNNYVGFGGQAKNAAKAVGMDKSKQKKAMAKSDALRKQENEATRGVLDTMSGYDDSYLKRQKALEDEATTQGKNAQEVYSNDINPRLKNIMEDAQGEAKNAMTLQEAGDPNNRVQQSVRALYDEQGQGVRKQGLQDAGVLAALGAQATAGQMGGAGAPLTGSQMQLMQATNNQQSGMAYARAQQNMQRLKEQGLERGFTESSNQYDRGQRAKDRYSGSVRDYESGMDRNIDRQRDFRGERAGYSGQRYGVETGRQLREMGYNNQVYGGDQEAINRQIAMANADNAAKSGMFTGVMAAGGGVLGGMFGGPAGAGAGATAGQGVGQGMGQQGQSQQTGYGQGAYRQQPQQQQSPYDQRQRQQYYGNYT